MTDRNIIVRLPLAALAVLFTLGGCDALKGPEMTIEADKTTIAAGGYEYAEITATVMTQGELVEGAEVEFNTESGSFSSTEELTTTYVSSNADGEATVRLYSPLTQGQTEVTAYYYDDVSGLDVTERITIVFGPPQANNLPVDGAFQLACDYLNVGALRVPKPDIKVDCNIVAQTIGGDNIPVDALELHFLAEAGVLEAVEDAWSGEIEIRYNVQGGYESPKDVEPVSGEPSRTGTLGEEHNPRDGVVSLLAIVRGSEAWTDLNDNGERDENEPFTDIGEPVLDVDDDGIYTAGVDEYFDANQNGEYDGPNGTYDADTYIGAQTKIVWTGPLEPAVNAGRYETNPDPPDISDNGSLTLFVYLLDRNLNPISSFVENYDSLGLDVLTGDVNVTPYEIQLQNIVGMVFDVDGRIQTFDDTAGRHQAMVYDTYPQDGYDPVTYRIAITYDTTAGPTGDGYFTEQLSESFAPPLEGQGD